MHSLKSHYLFEWHTISALVALTCTCTVAYAEIPTCRRSLAAHSSMTAPASESNLRDQHLAKGIAAFLHFLDVLLKEFGSHEGESLERKLQLLNFVIQSATPIQSLEMFSTERSHLLTLFRNSDALEKLTLNISLEEWKQIQHLANEKRNELLRITEQHAANAVEGEPDFIDSPDINGQVRLHHLLETRQYEKAIALLKNPKTTTRYINTRDSSGKTPLDFFEQLSILSTTINNKPAIEEALKNPNLFGGEITVRVAEILIAKSAMTGREMNKVDYDFLRNPLNRPHKESTYPNLGIYELADLAADNLTWFYEIGGNLDTIENFNMRLAELFVTTNHIESLKKLKYLGADLHFRDVDGSTLLHRAVFEAAMEAIPFLVVEGGLDINASNDFGHTPILGLDHFKIQDAMKMFADLGALDHQNSNGDTPSHYFTEFNFLDQLRALAENGANLDIKNKLGRTPLSYAEEDDQEILEIFVEYFVSRGIDPESRGLYLTDSNPPFYTRQKDRNP